MRVVYISKYARTPESGGHGRQYLFSKSLALNGNSVQLIYSNSNGSNRDFKFSGSIAREENEFVDIIRVKGPLIKLGFNVKRIWSWIVFEFLLLLNIRTIKKFNPDVIIVSSLSLLTFVSGLIIKRRLNIPLVLEVRDIYPLTLIEVGRISEKNPLIFILKLVEKYGYRNANLIISSLENSKKHFERVIKRPVNFKWLPMGFDDKVFSQEPDNHVKKIVKYLIQLKTEGKFIVGYAGTIGKANALGAVFSITNDIRLKESDVHFVFIGNGPLKDEYERKLSHEQVTFLDPVEKKYLHIILKHCDILINTWLKLNIYNYGISPNKWIDYMYSKGPILLALDVSSTIFDEAKCGWQIKAENEETLVSKIMELRSMNKDELNQKGLNGYNYLINNLAYYHIANELETELRDLLIEK